jgi:tetratricopeptide (TPR) repeat protein
LAAAVLAASCRPALREPPSVEVLASKPGPTTTDDGTLLEAAEAQWARRPDAASVREAEALYLQAARADETDATGLIGAVRAKTWLVDHVADQPTREAEAIAAVQTAQWCGRRQPTLVACDYWIAIAIGLQAREVPPTAESGLKRMVEALERAIKKDPSYERGGPHRVLALVLLRAPGWPLGPGDADAGLEHARAAVAIAPDYAPNVLALAEALADVKGRAGAKDAYEKALTLADDAKAAGDPDAVEWIAEANRALATLR